MKNSQKLHSSEFNKILAQIEGKPEERILSTLMLRSFMKARYSPENLGHFGLAAQYYCHFTSPIRRYPDLEVHRLLRTYLYENNINSETIDYYNANLDVISTQSSEREKAAVDAEREVMDMKMAEYMESHIGEEFDAKVASVVPSGMFVRLENRIEGRVHVSSLKGDYFIIDEFSQSVVGKRSGKRYRLGDEIVVKCVDASKIEGTIDFEVVSKKEVNNEEKKG